MNKTILSLVALGALVASAPVLAQQKAKAPPAPVDIPKGVFIETQPADAYLARDTVLFAKVRDDSGKIIGDVEDLVVNDRNEVIGVVMGVGGFLGAGEKRIAVRLSALDVSEKGGRTTVTLKGATKQLLAALPAFKRNKPPKTMLNRIKEKAQELTDKTVESSKEAAEKAREQAGPALEKAKDAAGKAYEQARDAAGKAIEKAKDAAQPSSAPAPKQ
ncbi:MAG: PRC-barrel domain-containing protein [Hyphomicrobiaceae bacterium]|nr:PRC-barrel domain-containing protein [Hyphomicrobiaceae bacterium]